MARQKLKGLERYQYIKKISNYRYNKERHSKARSIVAMLFWESRKTLTEYRNTKHCDALYNYYYGQKQQFIEAYAMLKEQPCNQLI